MKKSFLLNLAIYIGLIVFTITILIFSIHSSDYYTYTNNPNDNKLETLSTLEKQFAQLNKLYSNVNFSLDSNYILISLDENLIHFDFDSYILKASVCHVLNPLISNIVHDNRILVVGHTCDMGSINYNQNLSERRANAVKEYISENISFSILIESTGKGELYPISDNSDELGRKKNRRVEIKLSKVKQPNHNEDNPHNKNSNNPSGNSQPFNSIVTYISLIVGLIEIFMFIRFLSNSSNYHATK
jgi:outer membrane protein OmpA-like peptidoglycan-associated protein